MTQLPLKIDNLLMRWGMPDDAEAVAQFNATTHSDNPDEPEEWLGGWTRELFNGKHPTVQPHDFTVVVDTKADNKIVSTTVDIPQTWAYEGIPFPVCRPELIATHPDYRRRGLVRLQMEALHARAEARGDMVYAITGIPWYYRQFGYEMTVALGGQRNFLWNRSGNSPKVETELYRHRKATADDIPLLNTLYTSMSPDSPLLCLRDEKIWRHILLTENPETEWHKAFYVVETVADGMVVGYFATGIFGKFRVIDEMSAAKGQSLRALGLYVARAFKPAPDADKPTHLRLRFGDSHPVYDAFGDMMLEKQEMAYAFFMRVGNMPAFLTHIAPALEQRLATSVVAGHTGDLKIMMGDHGHIKLQFERGKIKEIAPYQPTKFWDMDAIYPDQTFLHLLFGHRSVTELRHMRADCGVENAGTLVLLNALFPKKPSHLNELG